MLHGSPNLTHVHNGTKTANPHPPMPIQPSKHRQETLNILGISMHHKDLISNPPLVSFRRPRNLRNLFVRAQVPSLLILAPPTLNGHTPCNSRRCKCCKEIEMCNTFKSKSNGRKYNIKASLTWKSTDFLQEMWATIHRGK